MEYFGENPKSTPPSVFFPVFARFIKAYKVRKLLLSANISMYHTSYERLKPRRYVGRPAKRALQQSGLDRTRANLQNRLVLEKWSVKFNSPSITTPRFLAVLEGVVVDETS